VDGCITNAPLFVDRTSGNLRLLAASLCIDAGLNTYVTGSTDLSGNPRIVGAAVDMGAHEYVYTHSGDEDGDGMSNGWELEYFDNLVGGDPGDDPDHDGSDNYSECIAGTQPFDAGSIFAMTNAVTTPGFTIEWAPCVAGRRYRVLWTPCLTNSFQPLQDNLEYPQNSYTDTVHNGDSAGFYKVEVYMQ
jgi:hypothetical protein